MQSVVAQLQFSGSRAFGIRPSLGEGSTLTEGILFQEPVHSKVLEDGVEFSCGQGVGGKAEEVGGARAVGAAKSLNRPLRNAAHR